MNSTSLDMYCFTALLCYRTGDALVRAAGAMICRPAANAPNRIYVIGALSTEHHVGGPALGGWDVMLQIELVHLQTL
jgi:hypothetical protein